MAISFKRITTGEAALTASAAMLCETFPGVPFTAGLLQWQYAFNPAGPVVGFEAWDAHSIVAHYACQPFTALVAGKAELGLLSLNTATRSSHQGRGLFSQLATATFEAARSEGFTFVTGVANANSTPGFTRRLAFQLVGCLDARLGIGFHAVARREAAFERTWTTESIRWRLRHPQRRYMFRGNQISSETTTPFVRAVLAADLVPDPETQRTVRESLGFRPVALWIGVEPDGSAPIASIDIPKRVRPSPLNLIFLDLSDAGRTLDRSTVRFRGMDFDAF